MRADSPGHKNVGRCNRDDGVRAGTCAGIGACSNIGAACGAIAAALPASHKEPKPMAATKTATRTASNPGTKTTTRAKPKTGSRTTRRTKASTASQDAIALLKADHREVKSMFEQFEKTEDDAQKSTLAHKICAALKVHAQIEEEIFYPAAYEAIDDDDLLDEAEVEHASAKDLIAQIEASQPGEPLFDAKVKVLGEYIDHHVKEEEGELFPECRSSKMDLKALGTQMATRKQELMAAMA
jgi:hemerythrin superfamily protein